MHTAVPSAGDSDPEPLQIDIGIKEVAALTTEEKLQHFEDICTGDALKKYEQAVSDYTAYEEKILNEHKEKAFAGSSEIHIYIDPSDKEKQNLLSLRTDCDIRVSQYPFLGGTRAVIASKNILIDNSFETKLKEAEQDFQFSL